MAGWFSNWFYDCCKRQHLDALDRRMGFTSVWPFQSVFSFETDNEKWRSLPQLEAVVEYYMNYRDINPNPPPDIFRDPWLPSGATHLNSNHPDYQKIDLRQLTGDEARIVPGSDEPTLELDGKPDLRYVLPNIRLGIQPYENQIENDFPDIAGYEKPRRYLYDTIYLEEDEGRRSRLYRIMSVDAVNHTVTLDEAPQFADTTTWRINTRPHLILIDSFGPRQRTVAPGNSAVLNGDSAAPELDGNNQPTVDAAGNSILKLDGAPDLSRLNDHFDTVYLPGDSVTGRNAPNSTYRIIAHDDAAKTITVAGNPNFDGGSSEWNIPAGVGNHRTEMTPLEYDLHNDNWSEVRKTRGHDHYDGMMFLVHKGQVVNRYRWTSYTGRHWVPTNDAGWEESCTSLAGNQHYFVYSFKSGKHWINLTFAVVDLISGDGGIGNEPRHDPDEDEVEEARYYFGTPVQNPPAGQDGILDASNVERDGNGKRLIRLHNGHVGVAHENESRAVPIATFSGSKGCMVARDFYSLRNDLANAYLADYEEFHGPGSADPHVRGVAGARNHQDTVGDRLENGNPDPAGEGGEWQDTEPPNWIGKVNAVLWLIRPDERPL